MTSQEETKDFVHPPLGEEVPAISGHYTFLREAVMEFAGKRVLYLVGVGVVDTSCCGVGGCGFALVAGYLQAEKYRRDEAGNEVSQVLPLHDEVEKEEIARRILEKEIVTQVNFWV